MSAVRTKNSEWFKTLVAYECFESFLVNVLKICSFMFPLLTKGATCSRFLPGWTHYVLVPWYTLMKVGSLSVTVLQPSGPAASLFVGPILALLSYSFFTIKKLYSVTQYCSQPLPAADLKFRDLNSARTCRAHSGFLPIFLPIWAKTWQIKLELTVPFPRPTSARVAHYSLLVA